MSPISVNRRLALCTKVLPQDLDFTLRLSAPKGIRNCISEGEIVLYNSLFSAAVF